ncbi:MAG TPA: flagellar hook-length control protein FliK [Roseateles sp.]
MLNSAQSVTPKPAALPPAQPAQPAPGSAGGPSFAQFLNEQPDRAAAPNDSAPNDAEASGRPTAAPAPAANTAATRRKDGSAPPKPPQAQASGATDTAKKVKDTKAEDSVQADDDDKDPETSGLSEFTQLIGMAVPPQAVAAQPVDQGPAATAAQAQSDAKGLYMGRAGRGVDEDSTASAPRGAADSSVAATAERRPGDAHGRGADAAHAKGIELAADKATAARGAGNEALQQTSAAPSGDTAPRTAAASDVTAPNFAAVLAQAIPTATAAADAAPVGTNGRVHAALHSEAFAPELGARVSLLAVEGVQQAELQLNPADMGPVAVQIVVDGAQAQVSFHAVQAETRQALEQSLPDLAAALQGQGLTLSGGGVFQQAARDADHGQDRADTGGTARASRGGGDRIGATAAGAAAPVRRSVGLLDTFA